MLCESRTARLCDERCGLDAIPYYRSMLASYRVSLALELRAPSHPTWQVVPRAGALGGHAFVVCWHWHVLCIIS